MLQYLHVQDAPCQETFCQGNNHWRGILPYPKLTRYKPHSATALTQQPTCPPYFSTIIMIVYIMHCLPIDKFNTYLGV